MLFTYSVVWCGTKPILAHTSVYTSATSIWYDIEEVDTVLILRSSSVWYCASTLMYTGVDHTTRNTGENYYPNMDNDRTICACSQNLAILEPTWGIERWIQYILSVISSHPPAQILDYFPPPYYLHDNNLTAATIFRPSDANHARTVTTYFLQSGCSLRLQCEGFRATLQHFQAGHHDAVYLLLKAGRPGFLSVKAFVIYITHRFKPMERPHAEAYLRRSQ
jgi:hypothetical protein